MSTTTQARKKPVPAPVKAQTRPQTLTSALGTKPTQKLPTTNVRPPPKTAPPAPKAGYKKPVPPAVKQQVKTTPPSQKPPTQTPKSPPPAQKKLGQVSSGQAITPAQKSAPEQPKADNWISRTVQGYVQGAGDYAGGYINSIGERVNKFGEGVGDTITNTTRNWGQGVSGYGNDIKDKVGVGGTRVATAGNPLGIAGSGEGKGSAPGAKAENSGVRSAGKGSAANPLGITEG